jgi:predicted ATP-grasp superfamily ATP-dependent carboligase
MTVRRLRQHPPEFGRASTFAESVNLPEVATSARRFLQAMRCHGLVEVEFKLDPRDGRYKLLDVNARTWGYHTLGARAGVDFPYLLYRSANGLPVRSTHARPGVGWVRLLTDVPTAFGEIWAGRLSPQAYLRSLLRVRSEAVFSFRDPLPGFAELALLPYLVAKRGT